jgi:hypothetical protein
MRLALLATKPQRARSQSGTGIPRRSIIGGRRSLAVSLQRIVESVRNFSTQEAA